MKNVKTMFAATVLTAALSVGPAFATTTAIIEGNNTGEVLRGTPRADTIYANGGPDLVYGYRGADLLYGGNEAGWGDKIKGGDAGDRVFGQKGHDALYGERGDDRVYGGYGADLVAGGFGEDTLDGGPGADEINARDGQKDTIEIRFGEGDVVYYDKGLDVLRVPVEGRGIADKVELTTERPPEGLFEPSGEILVEHEGEELLVAEKELKNHLGHGDEILDPTGRAADTEEGRN